MACTSEARERTGPRPTRERHWPLPGRDGGWYQLDIPSRIDVVGPLCAFLTVLGERHGLTIEEIRSVELSAYETCLNIIEHAYRFNPRGRITVRARFAKRRLVLVFCDRGAGIDPKKVPPPDVADPSVRLRGRGFGLEIIRGSVDRMRYRRTRRGENSLLLVKLLAGRSRSGTEPGPPEWGMGGAA